MSSGAKPDIRNTLLMLAKIKTGKNIMEVAEEFGISHQAVQQRLRKDFPEYRKYLAKTRHRRRKRAIIKFHCAACGKEKERMTSLKNRPKFCSAKCVGKGKRIQYGETCKVCTGKEDLIKCGKTPYGQQNFICRPCANEKYERNRTNEPAHLSGGTDEGYGT